MGAQGYTPNMVLCKDNKSEIWMLLNGKASCTSNSKHVAIKYFWSTDRVKNHDIQVEYCPTEKMLADYMSKAVQGALFTLFRNVIMGWEHISVLFDLESLIEERVENSRIEKSEAGLAINDSSHKPTKMTYAQALKCKSNVAVQNERIRMGIHPTGGTSNDDRLSH